MKKSFFKTFSVFTVFFTLAAVCLYFFARDVRFVWGVLSGALWGYVNFLVLFRLVEMAGGQGPKDKKNVFSISLIKFPVLYLVGFALIRAPFLSIYGLLVGLTASLAAFASAWVGLKLQPALVSENA